MNKILLGLIGVIVVLVGLVALFASNGLSLAGRTADNWAVGGNLTVAGTITGSQTSTLTAALYANQLIMGTGQTTITPAATTSVTAAQVCSGATLLWAPSVANATMTLPTSQAIASACLGTVGNAITLSVKNVSTTSNFNVVAGTGMTLVRSNGNNSTSTLDNTISSSTPARLTLQLTLSSSSDSTSDAFLLKYLKP